MIILSLFSYNGTYVDLGQFNNIVSYYSDKKGNRESQNNSQHPTPSRKYQNHSQVNHQNIVEILIISMYNICFRF